MVGRIPITAALTLALAVPVRAADCRQALALALDVSSSVDAREDALQRGGLAAALLAPQVRAAFLAPGPPVALAAYEWSGKREPDLLLDWQLIRGGRDLIKAAQTIARSQRGASDYPTAIGLALSYGHSLLQDAPECHLRTLDVSGDGASNHGYPPSSAYAAFDFGGITVNGLVINAADYDGEIDPVAYYRKEVLHGPGAFLEIADGFEDFERAMRRKLLRELTPRVMGGRPAPEQLAAVRSGPAGR